MKLETIHRGSERVHRLTVGVANLYLVELDGSVTLIDAGPPWSPPGVLAALGRLGYRPEHLRAILLTHRHLDHVGGVAALAARTGAEVVIHEADAAAVEGRELLTPARAGRGRELLERVMAFSDHRIFRFRPFAVRAARDGHLHHDALRLVHTPGHTPGHAAWLLERAGVVFAGDAAMNRRGRLGQPSSLFTLDGRAARDSQRRLAELGAELYAFGHGPPIDDASALSRLAG